MTIFLVFHLLARVGVKKEPTALRARAEGAGIARWGAKHSRVAVPSAARVTNARLLDRRSVYSVMAPPRGSTRPQSPVGVPSIALPASPVRTSPRALVPEPEPSLVDHPRRFSGEPSRYEIEPRVDVARRRRSRIDESGDTSTTRPARGVEPSPRPRLFSRPTRVRRYPGTPRPRRSASTRTPRRASARTVRWGTNAPGDADGGRGRVCGRKTNTHADESTRDVARVHARRCATLAPILAPSTAFSLSEISAPTEDSVAGLDPASDPSAPRDAPRRLFERRRETRPRRGWASTTSRRTIIFLPSSRVKRGWTSASAYACRRPTYSPTRDANPSLRF